MLRLKLVDLRTLLQKVHVYSRETCDIRTALHALLNCIHIIIYISGYILEKMLIIFGPRITVQYGYNLSILTNLRKGNALFHLKVVFNYLFIPIHLPCHIK